MLVRNLPTRFSDSANEKGSLDEERPFLIIAQELQ
jgi:hypothetical protein